MKRLLYSPEKSAWPVVTNMAVGSPKMTATRTLRLRNAPPPRVLPRARPFEQQRPQSRGLHRNPLLLLLAAVAVDDEDARLSHVGEALATRQIPGARDVQEHCLAAADADDGAVEPAPAPAVCAAAPLGDLVGGACRGRSGAAGAHHVCPFPCAARRRGRPAMSKASGRQARAARVRGRRGPACRTRRSASIGHPAGGSSRSKKSLLPISRSS